MGSWSRCRNIRQKTNESTVSLQNEDESTVSQQGQEYRLAGERPLEGRRWPTITQLHSHSTDSLIEVMEVKVALLRMKATLNMLIIPSSLPLLFLYFKWQTRGVQYSKKHRNCLNNSLELKREAENVILNKEQNCFRLFISKQQTNNDILTVMLYDTHSKPLL